MKCVLLEMASAGFVKSVQHGQSFRSCILSPFIHHMKFHYLFNKTYLKYRNPLLIKHITVYFLHRQNEKQMNANSKFHYVTDTTVILRS